MSFRGGTAMRIGRGRGGVSRRYQAESHYAPDATDQTILDLTPYSWVCPRAYSYNGYTSKVVSLNEMITAGTGILAVSAGHKYTALPSEQFRIGAIAADAGFGSAPVATLSTSGYVSNAPASAWKARHDGTGWEEYHVFSVTSNSRTLANTQGTQGSSGPQGVSVFSANSITELRVFINNATTRIHTTGFSATIASGVPTYSGWAYKESAAPTELRIWSKAVEGTGQNSSAAPSSGDPTTTMILFRNSGGAQWAGKWGMSLFFNRVLSDADRLVVQAYMLARFGLS